MRFLHENHMKGTMVYEMSDGRRVNLDAKMVRHEGVESMMRGLGVRAPEGRVDVHQDGRKIGSVPAYFHPTTVKSTSFFYEPRSGDFIREGDVWIADRTLGPGDLEAVPGFVWHRAE